MPLIQPKRYTSRQYLLYLDNTRQNRQVFDLHIFYDLYLYSTNSAAELIQVTPIFCITPKKEKQWELPDRNPRNRFQGKVER